MDKGLKKDFIWNTIGNALYAFSSMLLAFIALRYAGPDDGGIFGFGYSTLGQQFFIIAYFGMRPFHITDTKRQYSYPEYKNLRRLSAAGALILAGAFLLLMFTLGHYSARKAVILMLLVSIKVIDGIADLYESECQRIDKLYIAGMELTIRTLAVSAVMIIMLVASRDVLYSAIAAVTLEVLLVAAFGRLFESRILLKEFPDELFGAAVSVRELIKDGYLIFISVFIDFYVFSSAKYAVDTLMTNTDDGIFYVLFAPASIVYIAANFIIRPYLSRLSRSFDRGYIEGFKRGLKKLFTVIALFGAAVFILSVLIGRDVLNIAEMVLGDEYGGLLASRFAVLSLIILGGVFYALANLCYYAIIIMRRQGSLFAGYFTSLIMSLAVSFSLVRSFGITGAGIGFTLSMAVMFLAFLVITLSSLKKAEKEL